MELSDLQSKIDSLKAEWDAVQPLEGERLGRWWQKLRLEWNYNSNHIEGNTLTYGETRLLILQGMVTGTHDLREYEEMKAHDVAIEHVRAMAAESRPITEADVRDLNRILLKESFWKPAKTVDGQSTRKQIIPGQYKTTPNNVETATGEMFYFSSPEETPAKMAELVQWFRDNLEGGTAVVPLITAFHHRFSVIHPFDDGNGRTMRLLVNYALMRRGYPPLIIRSAEKKEYLAALSQADAGDLAPFEVFMAKNLVAALELGLKAARGESLEEPEDWQKEMKLLAHEHFGKRPAPPKSLKLLQDLAENSWDPLCDEVLLKLADLKSVFGVIDKEVFDSLFKQEQSSAQALLHDGYELHLSQLAWIQYRFSLKGFDSPRAPSFDVFGSLKFELHEFQYSITSEFLKPPVSEFRYDTPLDSQQRALIASSIARGLFGKVKEHIGTQT